MSVEILGARALFKDFPLHFLAVLILSLVLFKRRIYERQGF